MLLMGPEEGVSRYWIILYSNGLMCPPTLKSFISKSNQQTYPLRHAWLGKLMKLDALAS